MRQLLYMKLLEAFEGGPLQGADPVPRLYQLGSLGVGTIPADPRKPFMTMRQMPSSRYQAVRETSKSERQTWQLYCYDERGSLLRVDELLEGAEAVVEALEGTHSPSGAWCFEALWLGTSQDFGDETYDAVARYATIQLSTNK